MPKGMEMIFNLCLLAVWQAFLPVTNLVANLVVIEQVSDRDLVCTKDTGKDKACALSDYVRHSLRYANTAFGAVGAVF